MKRFDIQFEGRWMSNARMMMNVGGFELWVHESNFIDNYLLNGIVISFTRD